MPPILPPLKIISLWDKGSKWSKLQSPKGRKAVLKPFNWFFQLLCGFPFRWPIARALGAHHFQTGLETWQSFAKELLTFDAFYNSGVFSAMRWMSVFSGLWGGFLSSSRKNQEEPVYAVIRKNTCSRATNSSVGNFFFEMAKL